VVLPKVKRTQMKWQIAQFFELWWWRLYLKRKNKATYLAWKKNYWQTVFNKIEDYFTVQPHQKILELGCGPAGCFIFFTQNQITAIDPLIFSYENSLHFFKRSEYPNTTFLNNSIEEADMIDQYDVVLCFNAINHVQDIQNSLNKISKWVKPNGKVLLSVDAHNYSLLKKVFAAIPGDVLHPHQYTLQEYILLCRAAGLNNEKVILLKAENIFSHYLLLLSATK
jgi:2-polyprenyl-6-hydroxyphenyl methylase/3-demethylubiquinone-9 3-methyltransferase